MERRKFIQSILTASAVAMVATPNQLMAEEAKKEAKAEAKTDTPALKGPNDLTLEEAIKVITGGKEVKKSDKIKLTVPEIAENGAVVPVKVLVNHPMTEKESVKAIHVLNTANGNTRCVDVLLTLANVEAYFATRIKLSQTQEVMALVELSDGTFINTAKSVKVTIGGCG